LSKKHLSGSIASTQKPLSNKTKIHDSLILVREQDSTPGANLTSGQTITEDGPSENSKAIQVQGRNVSVDAKWLESGAKTTNDESSQLAYGNVLPTFQTEQSTTLDGDVSKDLTSRRTNRQSLPEASSFGTIEDDSYVSKH